MARKEKENKGLDPKLITQALVDSFVKLNPQVMFRNPVMFVVEIGAVITLVLAIKPDLVPGSASVGYNLAVSLILWFTVLFGNFAEAVAEGRGKAQAATLKRTKSDTKAKRLKSESGREYEIVGAAELRKDDRVLVEAGDLIPGDGMVVEGVAAVDESAITGESAPVLKEPGTDMASSVTGGTRVTSDWLIIEISVNPGESFLDKMIKLVEGAARQKTPNELALTTLLASLTLIFLIVVVTLGPMAQFLGQTLDVATLIALLVCLIPTTIGALLSAIGIAGMDRVTRFNVLAMSGKAVEAAGDVNVLILDKTGTITYGNRMAAEFIPAGGKSQVEVTAMALKASVDDQTPEGKSVVDLAAKQGVVVDERALVGRENVEFTADTRMSGTNLPDGTRIRKGAADATKRWVEAQGGSIPADLQAAIDRVAKEGGTPLVVAQDKEIYGVIYLKDTVKAGLRERFEQMRSMGIKTVMCTGDNPLTAATIALEAGVDEFIAEAKPEDKMRKIKEEQAEGKLVAMTGDGTNDAPALAQADVGVAMNTGTQAAKEAANMVDLDSDPTKLLDVVAIGKQLLITRGALTTFSIANDVAKYFAIIPALFVAAFPALNALNIMRLASPQSAILSALIFNALIIPALIPLAMKGVKYTPMSANALLSRNLLLYGVGGVIVPFIGIKAIDLVLAVLRLA
ncbi:MAG TPA: potassium-transporting ATPase subunit KdpB [Symbiobacteriaceae bacterium]|jgi:K+-transporting ATPase ATPase B chain|nr:potassium-transporting ATPase subunit KdpB [Symbiobacteriaceae bacterium]